MPVSTYRVQLRPPADDHPGFGFDDAAGIARYLSDLGITHLYCSPWLQAAPGSAHGYDVIDHSRLNDELGGQAAFDRMVTACRTAGLGLVLDIVPNHMAVSPPESQNAAWWSMLREGRASSFAEWFDVDWEPDGKVLVPVLGGPVAEVVGDLELLEDRIRYFEHELPIAPGTRVDGDVLATLDRQHYRLADWRSARDRLNYRRFFDVTSLAGVRVEVPSVFNATHGLLLQQVRDGVLDGLRVDHPDGLADPGAYLERLAAATGGGWVVVEKILEPGEALPEDWHTAGTTGYDVLNDVLGLFVDPAGDQPLTSLWETLTGDASTYAQVVNVSKRQVLTDVLAAEVNRLTALALRVCRDTTTLAGADPTHLREAFTELLVGFDVYRAYLPAAGPAGAVARQHVSAAAATATTTAPHLAAEIELVQALVLAEGPPGPNAEELVTRFQQTCGPVMAKGAEDTAFYRYLRLAALNEVGGDPARFGLSLQDFHRAQEDRQRDWPLSMTTLSTHDTKRSEDVRARIALLSQCPDRWRDRVTRWVGLAAPYRSAAGPDPATEQLVWQTLVGAWPLDADRAVAYLEKAIREAKVHTSWVDPVPEFESSVTSFVRGVLGDRQLRGEVAAFVEQLGPAWRMTALAQKVVQLTVPGVADTYQGSELWDLSLVDPDNRRPVDWTRRRRLLAALDGAPAADDAGTEKLHVVTTLLRLRRDRPEVFLEGPYEGLDAGARAVAFRRGKGLVTVAPIRAVEVAHSGWGADALELPPGDWRDVLTGRERGGGHCRLTDLLSDFPVAVLVTQEDGMGGTPSGRAPR